MNLLPHQKEDAIAMACGDDIPNFSEAGTGKTLSTLGAVKHAGLDGGVVLAPPIALPMWKREIEKFLDVEAEIIKTGKSPVRGDAKFQIMSYGLASNDSIAMELRHWASKLGSNCLIADESHALKTPTAARTKAVLGRSCNGRGGLIEVFDKCWMLTGTPVLRHADDMWSQLRATHGNELAKYNVRELDQFRRRYCIQQVRKLHPRAQPQLVVVGSQNMQELNKLLYGDVKAIRRTMSDVSSTMPPLTYRNVYVPIKRSSELSSLMKDIDFDDFVEKDPGISKALHVLAELKLAGCVDYVSEIRSQVLLGYWHTDVGNAVEKMLRMAGKKVARVMGGMTADQKERIRVAFNSGFIDVLVGQIGAMNVSWNLQESGHHVVILEDNFSPGLIEQFVKRVWRYGQANHVQVDFIKADHELDDIVERVRLKKRTTATKVTD